MKNNLFIPMKNNPYSSFIILNSSFLSYQSHRSLVCRAHQAGVSLQRLGHLAVAGDGRHGTCRQFGIGQPDEVGMTFQELAIYLNYNGPSGAEKAYKAALRKLKKDLYGGAYSRWLSAQKAIRAAKAEAEQAAGHGATPQRTWWEEKALADRFICEVVSLIRVYEVLSGA